MLVVVSASGRVEPHERVDLALEAGGEVVAVPVEVSDQIQAGDVLVRLATDRLALQVDQAKASLSLAEAQLARLQSGPRAEEIRAAEANVAAAEAQLEAATAERDQVSSGTTAAQIAAAEAEVASALTQQKKADDWHETTMKCRTIKKRAGDLIPLPGGQVITLTEGFEETICPLLGVPEEQARYQLEAAKVALDAARARLDELKRGADVDQLRAAQSNVDAAAANRDAAQAQLDLLRTGALESQIAAAEAAVTQARASLTQAELALEQATLTSPVGGTVAAVYVTVGEQASPGVPVVVVVDPSQLHVVLEVDEIDVGHLSAGQRAELTFDALPDVGATGTVEFIAPAATLNGGVVTYDVRVDLDASDAPIRTDMTANATIVVQELTEILRIPTWVVRVDSDVGQTYVDRRVGDDTERADVQLGVRYEGFAQVLDGLSEGDVVVRLPESSPFGFGRP
jgi:HlyD family secretion protein